MGRSDRADRQDLTGLKTLEAKGLTEGTCISTCNPPPGERRARSIELRLPLQDMKAVVLDDAGRCVRDGTVDDAGSRSPPFSGAIAEAR
jgi:fatty-acyl-CoA synthase